MRRKLASNGFQTRISMGYLPTCFINDVLDEAIDEADVREIRFHLLPVQLMMTFTMAC
jgi:hypothetical protein